MAYFPDKNGGGLLRGSSNQANSSLSTVTFCTVWSSTDVCALSPGFTLQKLATVKWAVSVSLIETHSDKEGERNIL